MPIENTWNIHPAKGKWIKCVIWSCIDDMRAATQHRLADKYPNYTACFIAPVYYVDDNGLITKKVGEIHLVNNHFGCGIVAHELQHFLSHWQGHMEWDVQGKNWEDIAYLAGDLTCEFWTNYYKHYEE